MDSLINHVRNLGLKGTWELLKGFTQLNSTVGSHFKMPTGYPV